MNCNCIHSSPIFIFSFDGKDFNDFESTTKGRDQAAMVTYNGHPIIIGGCGYDDGWECTSGSTSETFDKNKNKNWGRMDTIPNDGTYLIYHTAVVLGGKVRTFGGYNRNREIDRVD